MRRIVLLMSLIALAACTANPPPAPPPSQPKQFDVFFQLGSAKLTPEGQQVVDTVVAAIRDAKPSSVVVEGEADGSTAKDAQLADQRAAAVASALKAAGVDPSTIAQHATLAQPAQTDAGTHIATHKVTLQLVP
jgi:outer membrane protein OmpA-like peptidoglycan-associated protein